MWIFRGKFLESMFSSQLHVQEVFSIVYTEADSLPIWIQYFDLSLKKKNQPYLDQIKIFSM